MDEFFERMDVFDLDDSDAMLTAVHLIGEGHDGLALHVFLKGRTWSGDEVDEHWQIMAFQIAEHRLELGPVNLSLGADHPRLRERQEEWVQLMFAAAPSSEAQLLDDLRTAHSEKEWGMFGRFGLGGQLSFGSGVFAAGPRPLMEVYRQILEAHKMRPSELWPGPHPEHHYAPPPVLCLHLDGTAWVDDMFVLAQSFHATRLP